MPKDTHQIADGPVILVGRYSAAGRKPSNQDAVGAVVPSGRTLTYKGAAFAMADGISTSPVAREAAEAATRAILSDYYCTSDAWTVRTAASRVITATNAWLYGQGKRIGVADREAGYVCTIALLILKGRIAHVFHAGDSRIWRVFGATMEPLTHDHRIRVSDREGYLGRALGADRDIEIDYRSLNLTPGDIFVMTTDGVHDWIEPSEAADLIRNAEDLDQAAERIAKAALDRGSDDNLTVQIIRADALPAPGPDALPTEMGDLPVLAAPAPGADVDGLRVLREIHATDRSRIFLTAAPDGSKVALKIPSTEIVADPIALRRFMMEEWIARRIGSPHVLRAVEPPLPRTALYVATEWIEGRSLRQWMRDTGPAGIVTTRDIVGQLIHGLRAFHRREMLHQDLRPENVMIDGNGTVRIIDFGSTWVAGVEEISPDTGIGAALGTYQYTAPEYLTGDAISWRSDLYSLGTIAYELLTGRLPYGAEAAKVRSRRDAMRLNYRAATADPSAHVPPWMDSALRRAVHPDPLRRHHALSEFLAELRAPSARTRAEHHRPLMERDPVRFWQAVSAILVLILIAALAWPGP
ncbi:bifunctional protein-serine/threonine kinase/phosphatase [Paracoccus sp. TK19116]|uniref:Bifunctional protein-serine/threonine kinase/phosphatase n=1 Tax=Paracoccus albicereus TaxID=2922394 RepID=A0ABT1MT21_9RHOB|nr:bifunctional protein-serine/threonine kinase/phosphatase [Paracoccus albicereus]MCQ0971453.1 bifunctional protein-serine/threonine kinase/phosphatase [Paracoccus albicereus]